MLLEGGVTKRIASQSLLENLDNLSFLQSGDRGGTNVRYREQLRKSKRLVVLKSFNDSLAEPRLTCALSASLGAFISWDQTNASLIFRFYKLATRTLADFKQAVAFEFARQLGRL